MKPKSFTCRRDEGFERIIEVTRTEPIQTMTVSFIRLLSIQCSYIGVYILLNANHTIQPHQIWSHIEFTHKKITSSRIMPWKIGKNRINFNEKETKNRPIEN